MNAEWPVDAADAGVRLDKFLAAPDRLGSRSRAAQALERGKVFVNEAEAALADGARAVRPGDRVRYWEDRPGSSRVTRDSTGDLSIVFEDASLIVINKPPGLLSVPLERRSQASSVYDQLGDWLRRQHKRPHVVHRIDRDTSGLVLFAKSAATQSTLKGQFRRREPERVYWAVVYGTPDPPSGEWHDHLVWDERALIQKETHPGDPKAAEASCEYRMLERFATTSLIEVRLHTGKRNQIRIQARLRGHTLVGEQRYTYGPDELRPIAFPRQALHARALGFRHPLDGRALRFEAELPDDMGALLTRLQRR